MKAVQAPALEDAAQRFAEAFTHEHVRHLRALVDTMTPGPYATANSGDDDPIEYAADCVRQSLAYAKEHGLDAHRLHQVRAGEDGADVIVAMTGNGPKSEANAEAIAWLLSAAPVLMDILAALDEGRTPA